MNRCSRSAHESLPKIVIRKKTANQRPSLVDQPFTPPETSPARFDEPLPSMFDDIPMTTQPETSTSPIRDTSFGSSTFTASSTTQTTIETTSLPLALTTPFPTTQHSTIATTPPSTRNRSVIEVTPISSGKSKKLKKSPVPNDHILDRLAALEEAHESRAKRELKLIKFIKDQQAINREVTRQTNDLVDKLAAMQKQRDLDQLEIETQEDLINALEQRINNQQKLMNKNALQNLKQRVDLGKLTERVTQLETDLPSASNLESEFRKQLDSSLARVRMDFERLESRVGGLENSENLEVRRLMGESERLRGLVDRLQEQIEEECALQGRVNESLVNRYLAVVDVMRLTDQDVKDLRVHLMETFRGFLRVAEPRAEQVSRRQTLLNELATDEPRAEQDPSPAMKDMGN